MRTTFDRAFQCLIALALASYSLPGVAQDSEDVSEEMRADIEAPDEQRPIDVELEDPEVHPADAGGDPEHVPVSLPGGEQRSTASTQTISRPSAEGSITGMGASFQPNLSAGTGAFSVGIAVAPGRNGVAPSLGLTYDTAGPNGPVGIGWTLNGAACISRSSDRGLPRYIDETGWHPEEDRFVYGSTPLVPVDSADAIARVGGSIPAELQGWQMYLAQDEGSFQRVFRSPDSWRWVVQSQSGARLDFGVLPPGEGPIEMVGASVNALHSEHAGGVGRVHSWCLTRSSDVHGSAMYYRYRADRGARYLEDIYYVSPSSCGAAGGPAARRACAAPLAAYGARVHVVHEPRPDVVDSYRTTWRVVTALRVRRVEVTAYEDTIGARALVRRYHLAYHPPTVSYHSLLASMYMEGRPSHHDGATMAAVGDRTVTEASLGETIVGETTAPVQFGYHLPRGANFGAGPEGLDGTIRVSSSSPPHSVDEAQADLFDVNSDGLPDLVVSDPSRYQTEDGDPAMGVFFNGFAGDDAHPAVAGGFSEAIAVPVPAGLSHVMTLANANVMTMDVDGDGRGDWLHMPRTAEYGYFTPTLAPGGGSAPSPADEGWQWTWVESVGTEVDARLNLARDGLSIERLDVNADGLFDVMRTTGTGIQTWLNLGLLPGGEGRFGSASWNGTEWELSDAPVMSCNLSAGVTVDLAARETRLADMNGDGLTDLVLFRRGRVVYWPGRGPGAWGTGGAHCPSGTTAEDRHVEMVAPATGMDFDSHLTQLMDVDQDGAADIVQVRFHDVDVWLNRGGTTFASPIRIPNTPAAPSFLTQVRIEDIDGTGTGDLVWARSGDYRWIDMMGGHRPRVLTSVLSSLGGESTVTYDSSVQDYLRDLRAAWECTGSECETFLWSSAADVECDAVLEARAGVCVQRAEGSVVISTVVRESCSTDHGERVGVAPTRVCTRYGYHDGYYEGIDQEFRGFGAAEQQVVGDAQHPTPTTRTYFHQGRRPAAISTDRLAENPYEPLKGASYLTETFDEIGRYLGSTVTYTIRTLMEGLDGRLVSFSYGSRTDSLSYDTNPFLPSPGVTENVDLVHTEGAGGVGRASVALHALRIRNATTYAHIVSTVDEVDDVGHVSRSTAHGRVRGEQGEPVPDERIVSHAEHELLGGESGWLWVTSRAWTEDPALAGVRLGESASEHDPETGLVVLARGYAELVGAPFEFAGDADSESLAQTDQEAITSSAYDVWGQVTASCLGGDIALGESACLGYGEVERDPAFDQVPVVERVAVDRGETGLTFLETTMTSDRGLGVGLEVTDFNGQVHQVSHDGLGRPTLAIGPNVDGCEDTEVPTSRIEYFPTNDPESAPFSRMHTVTYLDCHDPSQVLESWAFVDGLGATRASLATGDESHAWVRGGITALDALGRVQRGYQPDFFDTPSPSFAEVTALPSTPHVRTAYDSFGRATSVMGPDGARVMTIPHALSNDVCDANDLEVGGPHYGTCTTSRSDGHGRAIDQVLRNIDPDTGAPQFLRLFTEYRADGAALRFIRAETADALPRSLTSIVAGRELERVLVYDTAGRRIASTDADTNSRAPGASDANGTWRYLFNRIGQLVAVRDPRGCGQNFYYDFAGRMIGESYVGCAEAQPSGDTSGASVPAGSMGLDVLAADLPVDARSYFDVYPAWVAGELDPPVDHPTAGMLTATEDRAGRSVAAYDLRGNPVWEARQIAMIPEAALIASSVASIAAVDDPVLAPVPRAYDEQHTYTTSSVYDHANRVVRRVVPTDPDWQENGGIGSAPEMAGEMGFNRRGLPAWSRLTIDGVEHPVLSHVAYTRDGLAHTTTYGDDAGGTRAPTMTHTVFDALRRPVLVQTTRTPTGAGAGGPTLGDVSIVARNQYHYDLAGNLMAIDDLRPASEWPEGFRPRNVALRHDALYRLVEIFHEYRMPDGSLGADAAMDWRAERMMATADGRSHAEADPMRSAPAPMVSSLPSTRVMSQVYAYDWLGSMTDWDDDQSSFYERSAGRQTNGDLAGGRPTALELATNLDDVAHAPDVSVDRGGYAHLTYGVSGNVVGMTVRSQCHDADEATSCHDDGGADTDARITALADRCVCLQEQLYAYRWDELNRLGEARRYDRTGNGDWSLAARQRYRYDAGNVRTIKESADASALPARIALYIGAGLERRGVIADYAGSEYAGGNGSESQYLIAGARVVWHNGNPDLLVDGEHRITIPLGDHLGSTTAVLDMRTGALLEAGTFYANGARESWLSQHDVAVAPEPVGFTGKEADEEVGLVYFGERYLMPHLGRWACPDPAQIHGLGGGEAMNNYHYVAGQAYQVTDPTGLAPETGDTSAAAIQQSEEPTESGGTEFTLFDANEARSGGQAFGTAATRWTRQVAEVTLSGKTVSRTIGVLVDITLDPGSGTPDSPDYRAPVRAPVTATKSVQVPEWTFTAREVRRFPLLEGGLRGLGWGGWAWSTYGYMTDDDRTFADHGNYWLGTGSQFAGEASILAGGTKAGVVLGAAGLVLAAGAFGLWAGQAYDDRVNLSGAIAGVSSSAQGVRGNASNRVRMYTKELQQRLPGVTDSFTAQADWYRDQAEQLRAFRAEQAPRLERLERGVLDLERRWEASERRRLAPHVHLRETNHNPPSLSGCAHGP
jgi:RHS repeat-associated protein